MKIKEHLKKHKMTPIWSPANKYLFNRCSRTASTVIHRQLQDVHNPKKNDYDGWWNDITNKELTEDYFIFVFVRNPFDRFVSAYEYLVRGGRNKFDKAWADKFLAPYDSFKEFILALKEDDVQAEVLSWMHFKPQYIFVCDKEGRVVVDEICKYERLIEDFERVSRRLGLDAELTHENPSVRGDYRDYYDAQAIAVIRDVYAKDFELFDYS